MRRDFILFCLLLACGLMALPGNVRGQEITNPEAEYERVRELAFSGAYDSALVDAHRLLKSFPDYGDVRILIGRVLAWQHRYDEAVSVLDTLLAVEPANKDAIAARNSVLLWKKDNTPVSTDVRVGYTFDSFTEPYNRSFQLFKAGVGHRFGFGPAAAYVNYGNLISGNPFESSVKEFQFEVEAYPKISKSNYAYLAYAVSPGEFFPGHRAAAEFFQVLPAGFGISAGINYYFFDRSTYIATTSVEKYLGDNWLSLRGYFYFKDDGVTTSVYLNARRYFNDTDYLQLTLGTGTAPDEPFDVQFDLMRLSAHSARFFFNVAVTRSLVMRLGAGYSYEEYAEDSWRSRYEGGVNLIYALKMK
ncbi:MAG: YaiO family outer membrane beta-barrel protein [Bacteroidales bacterium]|nr:YaiO family outer membrane beta-barrel protein [Bacteroidales bacterium]